MDHKMSFEERAKIGMEQLAKQKGVTIEQARAQAKRLSEASKSSKRKKR